ncbi:MAG TPA: hypothetical protein VK085_12560 [Pseudogracilibacillus sp.]|nr:hypothetical protein [Pseudogracilibacillus sp.]
MQQITLMETYLIETLRNEGISDEDILDKVKNKEADQFEHLHKSFDFTNLYSLADNLETILNEGYQVKFLTYPGLVNLLRMKYGKEAGKDFEKKETSIEQLKLSEEEQEDLQQWLSSNWDIKEGTTGINIVPRYT